MSVAPRIELTVDEMVAMLERSNLPTVVVEGPDDAVVFRSLEDIYVDYAVSVFPAGGRAAVLEIFDRLNREDVAFVVDKDSWVFTGVPENYADSSVITTNGYSVENDAYVDGDLERLLSLAEKVNFLDDLEKILDWYAVAISRMLIGQESVIKVHPNTLLDDQVKYQEMTTLMAEENFPAELRAELKVNYQTNLRGKCLLPLLMRHLSYKGRAVRHHHLTLLEITAKNPGPNLRRIFSQITESLGLPEYSL